MKKVIFSLAAIILSVLSAMAYDAPEGYDMGYFDMGRAEYLMSNIDCDGGGSITVNIWKNGISFDACEMEFGATAQMTIGDVTLSTKKNKYGEVIFEVKSQQTLTKIINAVASGSVEITLSNGKKAVWSGPAVKNLPTAIKLVKKSPSGMVM